MQLPSLFRLFSDWSLTTSPVQVSSRHPILHAFLQELLKRLQEKHGKCVEALTKKRPPLMPKQLLLPMNQMMQAMMMIQQARFRAKAAQDRAKAAQDQAKAANKVVVEAEKDNDVAQKIVSNQ